MSDGIGFGANARTALITSGLAEMSGGLARRWVPILPPLWAWRAGDLVLTCTDNQSRNRRFGMMLGQGMDVQSAQEKIGQVVEGYRNTKEVRELAHRFGVNANNRGNLSSIILRKKRARGSIDVIRSSTQGRAQQPLTPGNLCYDPAAQSGRVIISSCGVSNVV
ncbi:NAD(P)H-dependent glycerol-3-phosphate dehydrogenase [Escherichia coli]